MHLSPSQRLFLTGTYASFYALVSGMRDSSVVCSLHFSTPTSLFRGKDLSGFFRPMMASDVKSFLSTLGWVWKRGGFTLLHLGEESNPNKTQLHSIKLHKWWWILSKDCTVPPLSFFWTTMMRLISSKKKTNMQLVWRWVYVSPSVFNILNICCLGACSQTAHLQLYSSLVVVVQDYPDAAVLVVGNSERDHAQDLHVLETSVSATRQSDLLLHSQMYTSEGEK